MKPLLLALVVTLALLPGGCRRAVVSGEAPDIATSTSYLEAAARDLLGSGKPMLRLAEPGTCPGHFDLRPSQVAELRRCRLLLRFDFQKALDAKFASDHAEGIRVGEVAVRGGMGRPESYLSACRQTADHLMAAQLLSRTHAETRLEAIAARLDRLALDATNRLAQAGLAGTPVLASAHQREFCEWLGLKVVATFRAADTASVGEIEEAIDAGKLAGIRLVVANLPEGRRTADALAGRLKARTVVFANFPALDADGGAFDAMLSGNVEALRQALAP